MGGLVWLGVFTHFVLLRFSARSVAYLNIRIPYLSLTSFLHNVPDWLWRCGRLIAEASSCPGLPSLQTCVSCCPCVRRPWRLTEQWRGGKW